MGKKRNTSGGDEPKKRPGYPVFARIDASLGEAIEAYLEAQRPKPTLTSLLEVAIEDFLRSKGFWPRAGDSKG
jgi:hypothetical protein